MEYNIYEERMAKAIKHMEDEFSKVRAGRANPAILNGIKVDYYGMPTDINQVGSISVPEARQIVITPWDKTVLPMVERAINIAEIGINPTNDGSCIRLIFPELTEDRRKELVKDIKKISEETKVAVRNIRRDAMDDAKKMQKNNEMTEDELKLAEEKIQKITDSNIANVDKLTTDKEKDIMEI